MTKTTFTQEEKQAYNQKLRDQWSKAKDNKSYEELISKIFSITGVMPSVTGFTIIKEQIEGQFPDYVPYIDTQTFHSLKEKGFKVKKGEKALAYGITWVSAKGKEEGEDKKEGYIFPKQYAVFGKHQVEAIETINN